MNIQSQTNWCKWYLPWHHKYAETDECNIWYSHYAGFGPFQFHWYSNSRWF